MLPILGKPIVERVMEDLAAHGIKDFILVVSQDDRHITRHFQRESSLDADVRFVYQPQRLGMADALHWAAPLIQEDFILSACDNLVASQDIAQLLDLWRSTPPPDAVLTLMKVPPEQIIRSGIVAMNEGRVIRIVEKPSLEDAPSDIASLPLYCFSPQFLTYLPTVQLSPRGEYELQDAIQDLIDHQGNVIGMLVSERLTLTSPADLLQINRHFLIKGNNNPQLQPQTVGPDTHLITPLHIERGTVIGEGCTIGPNVYIERDCQIGAGAVIRDAILLRESIVAPQAHIIDQVVS
jgi:NDP-sugar pyrophosphorylase family protein